MSDSDAEVIVAAVALIVSLIALSATFMQVLQQYYASAHGYSECNETVMGKWAETKSRKFSWHELRYEVEFESPVIFVARPDNKKGPVPGQPIIVLDGTDPSITESKTTRDVGGNNDIYDAQSLAGKDALHTADNERASWLELLSAVQRMEMESMEWQNDQLKVTGPRRSNEKQDSYPSIPKARERHTLAVAVQGKRRNWVTMPRSITKPYATTTICHLIEMMASLGIYWGEFDRRRDRYRAEGNGFVVMGERLSDLGLCFSFQTYGKCTFQQNRVVPADEIKELCFGYVPTIYLEKADQRRLVSFHDVREIMGSLQMATQEEIAESLDLIGCNNNTGDRFRDLNSVTKHLFPVSFEILGMLCQPIHVQDTYYTFLPNPTPDRWDKRSISLGRLMSAFEQRFEALPPSRSRGRNKRLHDMILSHISKISEYSEHATGRNRLLHLKALCAALRDVDQVLTGRTPRTGDSNGSPNDKPGPSVQHDDEQMLDPKRREKVRDVLRLHFQEVLQLLNDTDNQASKPQSLTLVVPSENTAPTTTQRFPDVRTRGTGPMFRDMNAAGPGERQDKFMEVYFEVIRPRVAKNAEAAGKIRQGERNKAPLGHGLWRRASGRSTLGGRGKLVPRDKSPVPSIAIRTMSDEVDGAPKRSSVDVYPVPPSPGAESINGSIKDGESVDGEESDEVEDEEEEEEQGSLAALEVSHEDIWCTLVFRMICWLMLHDFNKMDQQLPKSELRGSRMPVYIS
ncbi:modin protein [Sarocladium implicatum]|nr:modin protein [Sarocladium implicatum]